MLSAAGDRRSVPETIFSPKRQGATLEYSGSRMITATPSALEDVLTDIRRLPEWNPAVFSVATQDSTAIAGKAYSVRAKLPGSPTITYEDISPGRIIWRLDGFQAHETGKWTLVPVSGQITEVTHTITHTGAIFRALTGAFQSVPGLRIDRLQDRVEDDAARRAGQPVQP
nr:SRPBCC family protein [Cryobacterium sp. Hh11]